uniref:Uncharacterized protein n=1 Tax=Hemiselmis andersenii TaxID=464988 RepID=A0A6U4VK90_HEMAN|mmetsp:Transcript_40030/g.93725  ORF Transcript_40030/g.93725 Transcript_40030/m.93725 type:complete len:262 (-) Transcript_40030:202-987(-)
MGDERKRSEEKVQQMQKQTDAGFSALYNSLYEWLEEKEAKELETAVRDLKKQFVTAKAAERVEVADRLAVLLEDVDATLEAARRKKRKQPAPPEGGGATEEQHQGYLARGGGAVSAQQMEGGGGPLPGSDFPAQSSLGKPALPAANAGAGGSGMERQNSALVAAWAGGQMNTYASKLRDTVTEKEVAKFLMRYLVVYSDAISALEGAENGEQKLAAYERMEEGVRSMMEQILMVADHHESKTLVWKVLEEMADLEEMAGRS